MKNVIVTGATGFIGSNLVHSLINSGYHVFGVIRPNSKNIDRIKNIKNISILEIDLNNISTISEIVKNHSFEFFFHMAWEGVYGEHHTNYYTQLDNVKIAVECIKAAKKIGCKRFIGAGSIHETECKKEIEQPYQIKNSRNFYKVAKLMAHYYCKIEASISGIDFLWPLLTNTYGEGEFSDRLISSTIRKILSGNEPDFTKGDQLYDFIYITDVVRAYQYIAERGKNFQNYIISSGDIKPLKNYLIELGNIINPNIKLNFGTAGRGVYLSYEELFNNNLFHDTGFTTTINFKQGIDKTLNWINSFS